MALPLSYNWRNLYVRKLNSGLTFLVVAVVVFVLAVLLAYVAGIKASLLASGQTSNLLILKPGATAESTSFVRPEEANLLYSTPGLASNAAGEKLLSKEICVQTNIERRGKPGRPGNVAVRGVEPPSLEIHDEVRIIRGRKFEPGALEAIVGIAAQKRFEGLEIGQKIPLGRTGLQVFEIVGVFDSGGGAMDSEIWAPHAQIADAYRRINSVVSLRLSDPKQVKAAKEYIASPAVNLTAKTEPEYYEELSSKTHDIIALTSILVGIMAIGAAFAVANTMYAAVDRRRREIAMLRTLGFSRASVIGSFVLESVLLCGTACVCGLLASLALNGLKQDFLSDTTWTVMAFEFRMTPGIIATALSVALVVAVLGALAPAVRAARVRVIDALRRA
ncbi:MAG: ABC transporter permease [Deltaproteobacteria bacterium]|nr:ABC transporter permease [Deltaproteobacteria bacterium]